MQRMAMMMSAFAGPAHAPVMVKMMRYAKPVMVASGRRRAVPFQRSTEAEAGCGKREFAEGGVRRGG